MITNAFTCTGPYAILITLGIKRDENRSVLPVPSKGRCAVSCSKSFSAAEYGNFVQWASRRLPIEDFERIPAWADVKGWPGMVIGACDYSARQSDAAESWNEGCPYCWDLSEVVCFDHPIPCRGNVGMWQMSPTIAAQVTTADSLARCVGETIATATDVEKVFRLAVSIAGNVEGFFVLPLDTDQRILSEPILVSLGDPTTTVVQPGEVFAAVFRLDARSIIIAHNHPSADLTLSVQDHELTATLVALGKQLGVHVLDHLIVAGEECVSMLKEGML